MKKVNFTEMKNGTKEDYMFLDKLEKDLGDNEISGIAYCVGSIDLKPINLISKKDILKCFSLNLFPIYDIVKKFHPSLKE